MDADWINCTHCGLKHRPRAQNLCPRCGRTSAAARGVSASGPALTPAPMPARRTPVALPPVPVTPMPASVAKLLPAVEYLSELDALDPSPLPQRLPRAEPPPTEPEAINEDATLPLGGALLLANAVLHVFEFLFLPAVSLNASLRAVQLAGTLVGVGVDALLGVALLRGKGQLRTLVLVRLLVGMFVFGAMSLYQAQYLFTLVVFAFSCGVLALVWGKPSSFLGGVALTAALLGMTVEVVGFVRLSSTHSLSSLASTALRPDLGGFRLKAEDTLVGNRLGYKMRIPSDGWYQHKDLSRAPEPHLDLWLSHPDDNGNLMVAVRDWSTVKATDLLQARDMALQELRQQHPDFQMANATENLTAPGASRWAAFSGHGTRAGKPFRFEVSVFKVDNRLLKVVAFAPVSAFDRLNLPGATHSLRLE